MQREAAIDGKNVRSKGLWMGFVRMGPGAKSEPHHHGTSESGIYIIHGSLRIRYGPGLEHSANAMAGDFLYVPPRTVHQEINLSSDEPVDQIVARDSPENVVVPAESKSARVIRKRT